MIRTAAKLSCLQSSLISNLSTSEVQAPPTVRVRIASGTPFWSSDWHCDWLFVVTTAVEGANAHRAIAYKSMKRKVTQLEFFLGVFEESKGIDSRQSADLSSKISGCLDTESLEQPTALVSTTLDRSMCNEFLEHLFP